MFEYLLLGEFVVAFLMGLAALSGFIWALVSGAFRNAEALRGEVLRLEGGSDERRAP